MLNSLTIEGFRCFDRFEMHGLARVNLVVGSNNSGKTALLEAIELWAAQGSQSAVRAVMTRRGEMQQGLNGAFDNIGYLMRHLFHGHELEPSQCFVIDGTHRGIHHPLRVVIESQRGSQTEDVDGTTDTDIDAAIDEEAGAGNGLLRLSVYRDNDNTSNAESSDSDLAFSWRLDANGMFRSKVSGLSPRQEVISPVWFVTTKSLEPRHAFDMLGEVMLTDEEALLITALQSIEPDIERVALTGTSRFGEGRGGIVVKCAGQKQRIPIGSMGDGIWRMLSLALALVNLRGGTLLIDEIDTGLHFSVMARMWKLVIETASRLNVQVFATSHRRDCYESLAAVLQEMKADGDVAAIHRIERGKKRTVTFDQQEIIIAAERGIEVR